MSNLRKGRILQQRRVCWNARFRVEERTDVRRYWLSQHLLFSV